MRPAMTLDSGQIEWWAFGEKLPNMAFTAATRTPLGRKRASAVGSGQSVRRLPAEPR